MRILLIVAWLFAGLGGLIYHFGPGQEHQELESLDRRISDARLLLSDEKFSEAVDQLEGVITDLPEDDNQTSVGLKLQRCKAQMMSGQLPDARVELEALLEEARADETIDPEMLAEVESTLAGSQYFMTWLMRLEGMPEEEWMPEIEASRQHYRQVAMAAESLPDDEVGDELALRSRQDLEAAIRLARMDLSELQGPPLPRQ